MKTGLCLSLFALSLSAQITIEGDVVESGTGVPIAGVRITAGSEDSARPTTTTDASGHFRLAASLPSGASLILSHLDFISLAKAIHYAPEATTALVKVELVRQNIITGKVQDEDGFPVASAAVAAVQYSLVHGQRIPVRSQSAVTNDAGEYRIINLPPGRYYVRAAPRDLSWDARYSAMYYPGTLEPGENNLVEVHAGDRRGGVDIHLKKVEGVSVSGRVIMPQGVVPSRLTVGLDSQNFVDLVSSHFTKLGDDGRFVFRHVPPGAYTIRYLTGTNPPKPGDLWDEQAIEVGSADLNGVTLSIQPAKLQEVSGRVVFQDQSTAGPLQIRLTGTYPGSHITALYRSAVATSKADGTFVMQGILPGHYDITVIPLVPASGVTPYPLPLLSAKQGSLEVAESGIEVSNATGAPLQITLSAATKEVTGRVVANNGRPASLAPLLFVPVQAGKNVSASSNLVGNLDCFLVPGDYHVYALPDLNMPSTFDSAAYLTAHANDFPVLHITPGTNPPLNLRLH
jgi:Carboxypeptidase regulatory-like domain